MELVDKSFDCNGKVFHYLYEDDKIKKIKKEEVPKLIQQLNEYLVDLCKKIDQYKIV